MPRKSTPDGVPARVIHATIDLLAEQGPSAVKARAVASAAGLSTRAVYSHFGGIPELIRAVIDYGFKELDGAFSRLPVTDDPIADLAVLALTSRRVARDNPHLYDLMFGLSTRGSYRPLQTARPGTSGRSDEFQTAYGYVVQGCIRLVDSGRVRPDQDPEAIAPQLWSAVHGFVTLELGDHFVQFEDPVRAVLQPMMVNIVVGLGGNAKSAKASHTAAIKASRQRGR
ncbi:transcriptional regulator [Mycobacterium sp. 1245805.9]|nr:TetR/AcrR family transcriptional regulator [Mycobacterium sp. 1245805.9]OBI87096.1 transcriptional regulator [Mycobacterium sp. 1245805.9]